MTSPSHGEDPQFKSGHAHCNCFWSEKTKKKNISRKFASNNVLIKRQKKAWKDEFLFYLRAKRNLAFETAKEFLKNV